jgi:phospholipid-binding lipoprotein MlaA
MNTQAPRVLRVALILALTSLLPACATNGPDPLERWNRGVFKFNEGFDKYLLEPAATGWDWAIPELAQTGVRNFFDNLGMPVTFVNDILQLKPLAALQDLSRIVINTTAGVAGFIDVATMIEIPENDEDFGQTLGRYGVPPGAYLVIPVLGPSTVRDVWRIPADAAATPHHYFIASWISATARTVEMVNFRAYILEEVRAEREDALDFYLFVRTTYLENREYKVHDGDVPPPPYDDEFEFDEFEDEDVADQTPELQDELDETEDD